MCKLNRGLTIIIADGDTGANDLGPPPMSQLQCDPSHPDWPSDSAYIVSVGSTFITPLAEKICYVENGANCLANPVGEVTVSVDMGLTWTSWYFILFPFLHQLTIIFSWWWFLFCHSSS